MQHLPLEQVRHRITVGQPLPFNVYAADATLLLASGQVLHSAEQIQHLLERGSLVDLAEVRSADDQPATAPRTELPRLWRQTMDRVDGVLQDPLQPSFRSALADAAVPLHALIDRDPDLAIFQVLRQEGNDYAKYGSTHAVHAAIVAKLVAQRLGWLQPDMQRAFQAALTMNIAIVELQGQLALQTTPPTDAQRQKIHDHPTEGRRLLELAGVTDPVWLRAVAEHHENRHGTGYPTGAREPSELATLLHRADVYTAKLSSRASREAEAADVAGREIFMQDPGHPVSSALVKEFGVYPPGCFVELACGETGVVIARGATVMTPLVASMTDVYGHSLPEPVRRDTREPTYAIVGVVQARRMRARLMPEKLAALSA